MDLTARAKTNVYRLSDAYAALLMVDESAADIQASAGKLVDRVEFMPASPRMQVTEGFYCVAPLDRHVIEAQSPSLEDVHQQVAAQYTLLIGHRLIGPCSAMPSLSLTVRYTSLPQAQNRSGRCRSAQYWESQY